MKLFNNIVIKTPIPFWKNLFSAYGSQRPCICIPCEKIQDGVK